MFKRPMLEGPDLGGGERFQQEASAAGLTEIAEQVLMLPPASLYRIRLLADCDEVKGLVGAACGLALWSLRSQMRGFGHDGKSSARKVKEWIGSFRNKFR